MKDQNPIDEPQGELLLEDPNLDPGQLSYRQLIWRRFRKSKMGLIASVILIASYIIAIGADFFETRFLQIEKEICHLLKKLGHGYCMHRKRRPYF